MFLVKSLTSSHFFSWEKINTKNMIMMAAKGGPGGRFRIEKYC